MSASGSFTQSPVIGTGIVPNPRGSKTNGACLTWVHQRSQRMSVMSLRSDRSISKNEI